MHNITLQISNPIIPNPDRIIISPLEYFLVMLFKLFCLEKIKYKEEICELCDGLLLLELEGLLEGLDEDQDPVEFAQHDHEFGAHGLPQQPGLPQFVQRQGF